MGSRPVVQFEIVVGDNCVLFDGPTYGGDFGWPLKAMTTRPYGEPAPAPRGDFPWSSSRAQGLAFLNPFRPHRIIPVSEDRPDEVSFPVRPIVAGFAANTAIFAAAWWVLLSGAFIRAALRRRRGLCPRCGYDRAGLAEGAACPECGAGEMPR